MVTKSEEKAFGRRLVQSIDADVATGVCGVVDRKNIREGLRGVGWKFVRHAYCR